MKTKHEYEPSDIDPAGNPLHGILGVAVALSGMIGGEAIRRDKAAGGNGQEGLKEMVATFLNMMESSGYEIVKAGVPAVIREGVER